MERRVCDWPRRVLFGLGGRGKQLAPAATQLENTSRPTILITSNIPYSHWHFASSALSHWPQSRQLVAEYCGLSEGSHVLVISSAGSDSLKRTVYVLE